MGQEIHALRTDDGDIWPDQTILIDGYHIAERLLEDVMFVLKNEGGKLVFSHLPDDSRVYVEGFANAAKINEWGQEAVRLMVEDDMDGIATDYKTTLHWGTE